MRKREERLSKIEMSYSRNEDAEACSDTEESSVGAWFTEALARCSEVTLIPGLISLLKKLKGIIVDLHQ